MSIKNQREQLMHSIIGQLTIIAMIGVTSWIYVIPGFQKLSESVEATNSIIKKYNQTAENGIPYTELNSILGQTKGKEELLTIIQSAPKETQEVIQKTGKDPYINWLDDAIGASSTDQKKLATKKARLNSILPTLNPISNNILEETVSMRKYIGFIEENILKQFNIESTVALGIQNIKYGKKGSDMPEVIGSFDTEIGFKSTNASISSMIKYVNQLGHYEVLIDTGSLISTGGASIMSNPLAMIDSLSLQTTLDESKPNEENSGRMVLRFYVRGSSTTDIAYLTESIKTRKTNLKKRIDATVTKCSGELTCGGKKNLELLSRKYNEFNRATSENKPRVGIETIYMLSSQLDSIIALERELATITK